MLVIFIPLLIKSQQVTDTVPDGFIRYYHANGKVSSEGILKKGQPDGYWKSFYENGVLKSEGNRLDFLLEGTWKFYDDEGAVKLIINYEKGKKQGWRITYTDDERIEEYFDQDLKQGNTYHYDTEGRITRNTPFEDGREHGIAKFFNEDSVVIMMMEYRRGVAISKEMVNRYDNDGLPHGAWRTFYSTGIIKEEYSYRHGHLDGYYKQYDRDGNLESIKRYNNGALIKDSDEIFEFEIRRDYYPDMRVKIEGTYRNGVADGIRKEFNPDGSLRIVYIMDMGRLVGSGIMDAQGKKQGFWKEYFKEGGLRSEGTYTDGIRTGAWVFYFPNGNKEQTGNYTNKGKEHGLWTWYYVDGTLRRQENYTNGLKNGDMVEYAEDGSEIAKGTFVDNEEDGFWIYTENGYRQEGNYVYGERDGEWKHFYPDQTLSYIGKYIDGYPDGKHTAFNPDGSLKEDGAYIMGIRHGTWKYYDESGILLIIIDYKNGIEIRYDYQLIKPEIKSTDL